MASIFSLHSQQVSNSHSPQNGIGFIYQCGMMAYLMVVPASSLQPVMDNHLPVQESHLAVGDTLHHVDSHHSVDSLRPVGDILQLVEGKLQSEVGTHQTEEGKHQAVVDSRLSEVGIRGSSCL